MVKSAPSGAHILSSRENKMQTNTNMAKSFQNKNDKKQGFLCALVDSEVQLHLRVRPECRT